MHVPAPRSLRAEPPLTAGMLPISPPEGLTSGREAGWPSGSCRTCTHCSCEPEPRHRHQELGVLLSSLWDEQSCPLLAGPQGGGEKNGAFSSKVVPGCASPHSVAMHPSKHELKSSSISVLCCGEAGPWFPHGFSNLNTSKGLGLSTLPGAQTSLPWDSCIREPVEGAGGPWPPAFASVTQAFCSGNTCHAEGAGPRHGAAPRNK